MKKGWVKRIILGILAFFLLAIIFLPLPDPLFEKNYSTILESRNGELLAAKISNDEQWRFPASDSIPENFKKSILLFEDEHFFYHPGFNPISMLKAAKGNLVSGKMKRGGSTLSMQVIRLARKNKSRTLFEKSVEIVLAIKLEILYSKEEILSFYTAHAPFGGNVVGLSAAAWRYYGRNEFDLSWGEAAALAVLPNSPALVFPGKNEIKLKKKRDFLLSKLHKRNEIDSITLFLSKEERLPGKPYPLPRVAPRLLTRSISEGHGNKRLRTTLDKNLQVNIQEKLKFHMEGMQANQIFNAAVLVVDIESGETKAYIGNFDSGWEHGQEVDVITANRSTGSLLKPILYAATIDEALISPKQLLPDYPIFYDGFAPKNFDKKYRGAVHADEALTRSLNVPFVMLLKEYGYEKFHQKLKRLGMSSLSRPAGHYGLSLILGGAESNLWQLTSMYAGMYRTLSRYYQRPLIAKYNANDYFSNSYLENTKHKKRTGSLENELSVASIWSAFKAMHGLTRPEEFTGWQNFSSAEPISWKTGTSFGFRDAWSIGLNGKYVVGVWMGNADGEGRPGLIGVKTAAPLMFSVFELLEARAFPKPPATEFLDFQVCTKSGQRASEHCEDIKTMKLPTTARTTKSCSYHKLLHLDASGKFQVDSRCYSVSEMAHKSWFTLPPVQSWYYKKYNSDYSPVPEFMSGCNSFGTKDFMELIYPRQTTKLYIPKEIDGSQGKAVFEVAHQTSDETIYWHLDGEYLGQTQQEHQMGVHPEQGWHIFSLLDTQGRELNIRFEVISN